MTARRYPELVRVIVSRMASEWRSRSTVRAARERRSVTSAVLFAVSLKCPVPIDTYRRVAPITAYRRTVSPVSVPRALWEERTRKTTVAPPWRTDALNDLTLNGCDAGRVGGGAVAPGVVVVAPVVGVLTGVVVVEPAEASARRW